MYKLFYTYILTNAERNVLYTGFTNDLSKRLIAHWIGKEGAFTTKYNAHYLVWQESTRYVNNAISKEKEIKDWSREKKMALIDSLNPGWNFLNTEVLGHWPPTDQEIEEVKAWMAAAEERRGKGNF